MNKRFFGILIFMVVIAVALGVSGSLFKVKSIKVDYPVNGRFDSREIVDAAEYAMNKNTVTLSKDKLTTKIETAVPYAKVAYIEKIAPGTLLIHTGVRYEILAIKVKNNAGYAILDNDMKVLRVSPELPENSCFVRGVELSVDVSVVGNFLTEKDFGDYALLKDMISLACSEIPTLAIEDRFVTFFRCIDFSDQKIIRVETTESADNAEYFVFSKADALKNFKEALQRIKQ